MLKLDTAPEPRPAPDVGSIVDGQYRLDAILGRGGVGAVYAALHLGLRRPVAIKLLHGTLSEDAEAVARFQTEARLLSGLGHPSFVSVFDFGYTDEGWPFLAMELIHGRTLRQRLTQGGPLPIGEVLALYQPLCEAMDRAHQRLVLHRDLKPDNLMLLPQGGVKILDFGMARLLSELTRLTREGVVVGSPNYLAPERVRGRKDVDARSDVFALGAILYECLAGKLAFNGPTPVDTMRRVISMPVPALRLDDRDLSRRLDEVIATACAKDPRDRYATALELWRALEQAASGREEDDDLGAPPEPSRPSNVKVGVLLFLLDFVRAEYGEAAQARCCAAWGADRVARVQTMLPNHWIELSELHALLAAMGQLFDDGSLDAVRRAGRYFAEASLTTLYKSLLVPGSPEMMARRAPLIFRFMYSGVDARATRIGPARWCIQLRGEPTLSAALLASSAGWIHGYLELAGAADVQVSDRFHYDAGRPVGDILLSFSLPAA